MSLTRTAIYIFHFNYEMFFATNSKILTSLYLLVYSKYEIECNVSYGMLLL